MRSNVAYGCRRTAPLRHRARTHSHRREYGSGLGVLRTRAGMTLPKACDAGALNREAALRPHPIAERFVDPGGDDNRERGRDDAGRGLYQDRAEREKAGRHENGG